MKKERYDVIIVGAGIGGLQLAKMLSKTKLNVLLLEKRPAIKKLVNHIYGTPWEYVKKYNLQKYVIQKCGFGYYGPNKRYFRKLPGREFTVVDVNPWATSMELTCKVKTNAIIKKLIREEDSITLVDQNKNQFNGKIVVDCSGDAQVISTMLGIEKSRKDFLDYSYVLTNINIKKMDEMFYFQDTRFTNCGGWYYPLTKNSALLGMSEWTEQEHLSPRELKKRIEKYVTEFYPFKEYFKGAKRTDIVAKIGPVTSMHTSIAEDNYLAVGDAAGAGTPLIGLGFYIALEMAESAYNVIKDAFKQKDFSKTKLKEHQKTFHNKFGRWYKWSNVLRYILLNYTTNKEIDLMTQRMDIYDDQEYYDIILSYISPWMIVKLLAGNFIWFHVGKNALRYHFSKIFGFGDLKRRPLKM